MLQVNEKLTSELEMMKQELNTSQSQLQEATAERVINSKQITDLQAESSQLIREKDDVRKMNEGRREELKEMKEKYIQLRWGGGQALLFNILRSPVYFSDAK